MFQFVSTFCDFVFEFLPVLSAGILHCISNLTVNSRTDQFSLATTKYQLLKFLLVFYADSNTLIT